MPTKFAKWKAKDFKEAGFRVVPGAVVRHPVVSRVLIPALVETAALSYSLRLRSALFVWDMSSGTGRTDFAAYELAAAEGRNLTHGPQRPRRTSLHDGPVMAVSCGHDFQPEAYRSDHDHRRMRRFDGKHRRERGDELDR